jgi:hypothetical protein
MIWVSLRGATHMSHDKGCIWGGLPMADVVLEIGPTRRRFLNRRSFDAGLYRYRSARRRRVLFL